MDKGLLKNIIIALLLSITIFSIYKYISSLREKYDLLNEINRLNEQATILENEKQNLMQNLGKERELKQQFAQENSELKGNLRASRKRLSGLFAEIGEAQKEAAQLNSQFYLLKAENSALKEQEMQVSQENENLKARLSSIAELRKAMREVKKQIHRVGTAIQQKAQEGKTMEGNRGFLIKDGQINCPAKVKIEVVPAPAPVKE